MTAAKLSIAELAGQLRRGRVLIPVGPLLVRIEADSLAFAEAFHLLYGNTPLVNPDHEVADLVLQLRRENRKTWQWYTDGEPSYRLFNQEVVFAHFEWAMHLALAPALAPSTTVHAAVAARDDGTAIALVGRSGSGKSTLLAGLVTSGWRLVADEFLVLRPDGGIDPVPSVIALKGESIALLRGKGGIMGPEAVDHLRGSVAHLAAPRQVHDGAGIRIQALGFPYFNANDEPALVRFHRGETILRLAEQSHNFHLIGSDGFRQLARLAHAPAFAMRYGSMDAGLTLVNRIMGGE